MSGPAGVKSATALSCLQMLQNYDLGKVPGFGSNYSESLWHFNVGWLF